MTLITVLAGLFLTQPDNLEKVTHDRDQTTTSYVVQTHLDTTLLYNLTKQIKDGEFGNIISMIVYKNDELVYEEYFSRKKEKSLPDKVHCLQSGTKSVASLLIGILKDKGYIKSIDERIATFFPEYNFQDSLKRTITIRNLLLMSSGILWNEGKVSLMDEKINDIRLLNKSKDYLKYYFDKPMETVPGTVFQYSGGCSIALGEIIERASGMTVEQFANKFLFEPLAITRYEWTVSKSGQYHTGGGLYISPKDFAKLGLMTINKGKWNGQQIISENWIQESLSPHIKTDRKNGLGDYFDYGYQWWTIKMDDMETISARGWGDQRLVVIPHLDMVVVVNATNFFDKGFKYNIDELLLAVLRTNVTAK
jgi:CubicO group peptidase (beta-lactamase class C family)